MGSWTLTGVLIKWRAPRKKRVTTVYFLGNLDNGSTGIIAAVEKQMEGGTTGCGSVFESVFQRTTAQDYT